MRNLFLSLIERITGHSKEKEHDCSSDPLWQLLADRLLERLDYMHLQPKRILDLSINQKYTSKKLMRIFKKSAVSLFNQENFQSSDTFDLIFINGLQYENVATLKQLLSNIFRVSNKRSVLLFNTFGPLTLQTWKNPPHFIDLHDIGDLLLSLGFIDPVMDSELLTINYDSFGVLENDFRSFSSIKNYFDQCKESYQNQIPEVALELVTGHVWGRNSMQKMDDSFVGISIDDIPVRRKT